MSGLGRHQNGTAFTVAVNARTTVWLQEPKDRGLLHIIWTEIDVDLGRCKWRCNRLPGIAQRLMDELIAVYAAICAYQNFLCKCAILLYYLFLADA
jgi:hypothetical protein